MANLRLNFACGPYDRTQALRDGTIKPDGIDLNYITLVGMSDTALPVSGLPLTPPP